MRDNELSGLLLELADLPEPADPVPAASAEPANPVEGAAAQAQEPDPLLDRLVQARTVLELERSQAPALCAELLAAPPEEQLGRIAGDRRLQSWGLCELLLDRSQRVEERDPIEAGRLAALALAAAERVDTALHLPAVTCDLQARIWGALGEARRQSGRTDAAEEALRQAASCLAQGTGDLLVEARLLEFEAALRHEQGRGGEATALLRQAASRYLEAHEFHHLARVAARREQILREAPRPALPPRFAWRPPCREAPPPADSPAERS